MRQNAEEQLADSENIEEPSLREKINKERREAEDKKKEEEVKKEKSSDGSMATNYGLRWAWGALIPSWGLSLIYINTHCFLRWVFPSAFCKLGDEWIPRIITKHSSKNIAGTVFGIVEVMGLLILDIIAFFVIFGAIALIAQIVGGD